MEGERGEEDPLPLCRGHRRLRPGLREAQSHCPDATPYDRYAIGVHHVCIDVPSRAAVDERADWVAADWRGSIPLSPGRARLHARLLRRPSSPIPTGSRSSSGTARATGIRSPALKLSRFSDLHRDLGRAARLVEMSADADVVIGAGDFASVHEGLDETIAALAAIEKPTVLVPGNNETEDALRDCRHRLGRGDGASRRAGGDRRASASSASAPGSPSPPGTGASTLMRTRRPRARRLPRRAPCWSCIRRRRATATAPVRGAPRQHCDRRGDRAQSGRARGLRPHPRGLGRALDDRRLPRSPTSGPTAPFEV